MKNVVASAAKQSTIAFFILVALVLFGCAAKQEPEVDFKPVQVHWILAEGEDESQMPRKDNCVILLTGRLMGEAAVQASQVGELNYEVLISRNAKNPEILEFSGICADLSMKDLPECRWRASCDEDLKIVVKFDNGD